MDLGICIHSKTDVCVCVCAVTTKNVVAGIYSQGTGIPTWALTAVAEFYQRWPSWSGSAPQGKVRKVILLEVLLSPLTATHILWPSQLQPCQQSHWVLHFVEVYSFLFLESSCVSHPPSSDICKYQMSQEDGTHMSTALYFKLNKYVWTKYSLWDSVYISDTKFSGSLFGRTGWVYFNNNYKKKTSFFLPKLLLLCFSATYLNNNYVDRQFTAVDGCYGDLISFAQEMFI